VKLIISLVVYKTPVSIIQCLFERLLENIAPVSYLVNIFDNANDDLLREYCSKNNFNYYCVNKNIGFGRGHNYVISRTCQSGDVYLFINPDILIDGSSVVKILTLLKSDSSFGLVSPKLVYPDGKAQNICRKLPSIIDLIGRRLIPVIFKHESIDVSSLCSVPFIHGACLFVKTEVINKIGGFDPRYFLYMEDLDLCRRIAEDYEVVYFPEVIAIHEHGRGSRKNIFLLLLHLISAIKYFDKWGWFFDKKRDQINAKTRQLHFN
jgi:GT2 family glycosyltransferase